eukprot:2920184-Prymnesium_polylepis.1
MGCGGGAHRASPSALSHCTTFGIESVHVKPSMAQPSWYSFSTNFLTVAWSSATRGTAARPTRRASFGA